jgi:hypothetical protein
MEEKQAFQRAEDVQSGCAEEECYHCDEKATTVRIVYNPADAMRNPPVTGIYHSRAVCEEHDVADEDEFYCEYCGKDYIVNHSWDVVAVLTDNGYVCQKCFYTNLAKTMPLKRVLVELAEGNFNHEKFFRMNSIPGKEAIWEGEFAPYSDFPGHQNAFSVLKSIKEAAEERNVSLDDEVYTLVTHGYQFSVALAVYA